MRHSFSFILVFLLLLGQIAFAKVGRAFAPEELSGFSESGVLLPPSDSICDGSYYLTTQAECDQFAADHAGCTTLIGDITIDDSAAAIDSVYGLDSLRVMVGDLVVEYTGVPFVFNTLNSLDSLAGDLTILNCPEYFKELSELDYTENIFLQNTQLDGTTGLVNLRECQSLMIIADNLNQSNIFNELNRCPIIEIRTESIISQNGGNLQNSFVQLISVDTVIVDYFNMSIVQSFLAVQNIDLLQLGSLSGYLAAAHESFDALTNANTVFLHTNYSNINLPNLVSVENIHIEEYPPSIIVNEPILESLETISGTAYLWICRDIIELSELRVAGELNIFSQSTYEDDIGPSAINLPKLEFVQGNLEIRASPFGQFIDTSLHSLYAPLLTNVGGSISIRDAPALTSCISPAFCESANYSPNFIEVSGGPGCSSVAEIQAQCEPISPAPCEGNFYITTQEEYDQFAADHADCSTFIGDIIIDNSAAAIDSVHGLDSIRVMVGDLIVDFAGNSFQFNGLNGLDSLAGELALKNNLSSNTTWFNSFMNLRNTVALIIDNVNFNFGGFGSLTSAQNIIITNASEQSRPPNFSSLINADAIEIGSSSGEILLSDFFSNLISANNIEFTSDNSGGTHFINSFNNLVEVDTIIWNTLHYPFLHDCFNSLVTAGTIKTGAYGPYGAMLQEMIDCFEVLTEVGELTLNTNLMYLPLSHLEHADNILLVGVFPFYLTETLPYSIYQPQLESLRSVSGSASIFSDLRRVKMDSLSQVGGQLSINYLTNTDSCNTDKYEYISLKNLISVGQSLSIHGTDSIYIPNLTTIGDGLQLSFYCGGNLDFNQPESSIYASGTVYYDVNCDQQFNNDDALVSYPVLLQGDTVPIGSSGQAGYFFVPLELNSTTSFYVQHSSDWTTSGPIIITTTDSLQVFTDIQIGLCPVTIIHDVAVNVNASMDPRPGFTVRYNLVPQNLWLSSDEVTVTFSAAQMPGAVITGYAEGGTLAGSQVSFTTELMYGQSQTLWVDVLIPAGTPLGTAYAATATIALSDAQAVDSHPENNNYTLAQTVIGSYDPNDKLVMPAVIDLLDIDSTQTATLEYTIRFQNTGTAEAFFVRVLDTLSQAFDITTFELIATSHPCEVTFHDNHSIEWFFDNIMLPDSFTNEPESYGFIQFHIQTLPLSEPFILENEAAIYFDFNEPVITPPAVTSVVICAEAGEACDDGDSCTANDLIQSDCVCAGTFADSDSDGICDTSEIAGCTDMEACNYDANATDDDGSCVYVESLTIEGNLTAVAGVSESYSYPGPASSSYQWTITPGTIQSGQGTTTVSVIWDDALMGTLQVTETTEAECLGSTVLLEIDITPNTLSHWNAESIIAYPNPANDVLYVAGDIPTNAQVSIFNGIGQCVYSSAFQSTIEVHTLSAGLYHMHISNDGTYRCMQFTIAR